VADPVVEKDDSLINQAVAQGGAYELIRKRLLEQGQALENKVKSLNQQREAEPGCVRKTIVFPGI
jgi:hypothetical protein